MSEWQTNLEFGREKFLDGILRMCLRDCNAQSG